VIKTEEDVMLRECGACGREQKFVQDSGAGSEVQNQLGRLRHSWEDNINMALK
jgi:hypothetical protein